MKYVTLSTLFRVITAVILVVALTKQPYDFYTILKLVTCFTSAFLVYVAITTKNYGWIVVFLFVIFLFNPIKAFPIKRETWAIIDVITAVLMLGSIFLIGEKLVSRIDTVADSESGGS